MYKRNWIIGITPIFASIGFISTMITNPLSLFTQILFIGVFAGVIYLLYRFMTGARPNNGEQSAYRKAVKQSQLRAKKKATPSMKKPLKRRSAPHLTVIEGKKNKKKDRAIF